MKMKKLLFILAVAVISLQSCNAGQAKNKDNENNAKETPTETVSQSSSTVGGTVKLNKAKFLAEVWDYENSPKEWKYKGTKPALIDFYADWCGPCKMIGPKAIQWSDSYGVLLIKVDVD